MVSLVIDTGSAFQFPDLLIYQVREKSFMSWNIFCLGHS